MRLETYHGMKTKQDKVLRGNCYESLTMFPLDTWTNVKVTHPTSQKYYQNPKQKGIIIYNYIQYINSIQHKE